MQYNLYLMTIAIDISNCFHKSYAIVSNYEGFDINQEKWQLTLGRKFVTDVLSIIKKFDNYTKVILCFDSSNYFRKQLRPDYKGNRTKKEQSFYDLLNELENVLLQKGLNVLKINGLEADDLLALISEQNKDFTVLVSNDEDVRQLVSNNTVVFTANTSNLKVYCNNIHTVARNIPQHIDLAVQVNSDLILYQKLFLGCTGDNVERLLPKGQGPKKVEKIYELVEDENYTLTEAIKFLGYNISNNKIHEQFQMVGLSSIYMQENLVDEFYEKSFNLDKIILDMKQLLTGTRFFQ